MSPKAALWRETLGSQQENSMSAVLNTNIASLWASKNLLGAQNKLAASVERLSSGLRINRARDDAAGLGVANSLTAQINGANQGIRNLNDAISMVQTAEGAIAAASEMGQRILMLATQGANGTLGATERSAIQAEMKQLIESIDKIGGRTAFSGNRLLSGLTNGKYDSTKMYSMQISNTASDKVELLANAFADIGTAQTTKVAVTTSNVNGSTVGSASLYYYSGGTYTGLIVGGTQAANTIMYSADNGSTYSVATSNQVALGVGLYRSSGAAGSSPTYTSLTSSNYFVATSAGAADQALGDTDNSGSVTSSDTSLNDAVYANALIDDSASTATAAFQVVQTAANAYVVHLGEQRSLLGAYQNQMEYTLSNITELSSNLQSARSRVIDTDYASETAALTKGQILQQAATAMLAQANQMPNVILTLLK